MKKRSLRRWAGRIALALIVLVIFVVYPLVSLMAYNTLSLAATGTAKGQPAGQFEDIRFPARGASYEVYAFYLPGAAGAPALINVHGWRGSRHDEFDLKRAEGWRALGYTVLSLDLSDSRGDTRGNGRISMGDEERYDVLGGFDYLLGRGFGPEQIGLVGVSMGGATVLMAAGTEPRIRAVWSDSPFASPVQVATEQTGTFGYPTIIVPGGFILGALLTGNPMWDANASDQGASLAANKQAVQLVHCQQDGFVFYAHSQEILRQYRAAGVEVDLWTLASCSKPPNFGFIHATGFVDAPDEYMARLDAFFKKYLGTAQAAK
jgi:hypothetical protein